MGERTSLPMPLGSNEIRSGKCFMRPTCAATAASAATAFCDQGLTASNAKCGSCYTTTTSLSAYIEKVCWPDYNDSSQWWRICMNIFGHVLPYLVLLVTSDYISIF